MNSRPSWTANGPDSSTRERADTPMYHPGASLGDALEPQRAPPHAGFNSPLRQQNAQDVNDIHQRLDTIARQIESISRPANRPSEPVVARQLNDAISRLDARLTQMSAAPPQPSAPDATRHAAVERAAARVYSESPPLNPGSLEFALSEINARQNELDGVAPRTLPPRSAPPMAPPAPQSTPDLAGLERHLFKITSQIEALQRPNGLEQSIAAFRNELADIRRTITEAMPRRAIESIENEIRSLSRRIDENRHNGIDGQALAGVERALSEIREVLLSLKPAEQLAGFDEAIRNLGGKLDLIMHAGNGTEAVQQLEGAIAALRAIVSNVASNEALARLGDDVRMLGSKVDQLARMDGASETFSALEQRIAVLTTALESRDRTAAATDNSSIEGALRGLSERIDRLPVGNDGSTAIAHLEQRISYLLERLDSATDHRSGHLGRVEQGLQDILHSLERQHTNISALSEAATVTPAASFDSDIVHVIKRELSDMRFNQSEAGRSTQDALEVVHSTLGHVVDRLAMIEDDLKATARDFATPAAAPIPAPVAKPSFATAAPLQPDPPSWRPELPNPAAAQAPFASAYPAVTASVVSPPLAHEPELASTPAAYVSPPQAREAIDPSLPPDYPIEPGTLSIGRGATPSERIAASQSAIGDLSQGVREQGGASSFIAAARRAAQAAAAANEAGNETSGKLSSIAEAAKFAKGGKVTSRIRSLLVGASVVVIVLSAFKMTMTLLDPGAPPALSAADKPNEPLPLTPPAQTAPPAQTTPLPPPARMFEQQPAVPSFTSPTPIGRQSYNAPASSQVAAAPQVADNVAGQLASADVTGTIPGNAAPPASPKLSQVPIPAAEKLPDAIGPQLRAAALRGDPTAAYEVGVRFAEGKGVTANLEEAAKWYDRAAQAGVVPAMFRLGTLNEKGLGIKKDIDIARRFYMQAAERGNAKAMHNLAVLDADGGSKGANYKSAADWFRKAADRGVADSQFNLGILYARGIGVEQNLAESFKWFSLAAAQGDADAGRKRDDVAKRLDPQSLAAAKLAIQTFTPEPQPGDATAVATPAGGWDSAAPKAAAAKPAPVKRAAR